MQTVVVLQAGFRGPLCLFLTFGKGRTLFANNKWHACPGSDPEEEEEGGRKKVVGPGKCEILQKSRTDTKVCVQMPTPLARADNSADCARRPYPGQYLHNVRTTTSFLTQVLQSIRRHDQFHHPCVCTVFRDPNPIQFDSGNTSASIAALRQGRAAHNGDDEGSRRFGATATVLHGTCWVQDTFAPRVWSSGGTHPCCRSTVYAVIRSCGRALFTGDGRTAV